MRVHLLSLDLLFIEQFRHGFVYAHHRLIVSPAVLIHKPLMLIDLFCVNPNEGFNAIALLPQMVEKRYDVLIQETQDVSFGIHLELFVQFVPVSIDAKQ